MDDIKSRAACRVGLAGPERTRCAGGPATVNRRAPGRVELLASTPLFEQVPTALLERVAASAGERTFGRGQFVFQQGDPGGVCYVIAEGSVKVYTTSADGAEVIHATLGPGDSFGELSFLDGGARSATVEALSRTRLVVLQGTAMEILLGPDRGAARALLAYQGNLIRRLTEQAADLVVLDLPARVAKCLERLAATHGVVTPQGILLETALTQSDIAALVGASRPSVNQALGVFTRRGWIRPQGRALLLTDLPALRGRYSGARVLPDQLAM